MAPLGLLCCVAVTVLFSVGLLGQRLGPLPIYRHIYIYISYPPSRPSSLWPRLMVANGFFLEGVDDEEELTLARTSPPTPNLHLLLPFSSGEGFSHTKTYNIAPQSTL